MPLLSFFLLCFCWGSTFIPLKEGLGSLSPLLFAGLRFVLAGSIFGLVLWAKNSGQNPLAGRHLFRLMGAASLTIALNYGLLFWGAQFLPSGISGLVDFGAVALSLTGSSLLLKLEKPSWNKLVGLSFGLSGLLLLVLPKLGADKEQLLGIGAIALGGVCYGFGSLLIRPLIRRCGVLSVTSIQMLFGGSILLFASGATPAELSALQEPRVLLSLAYLIAVGLLLGFWLYNRLLSSWEVSRLALYNFVSPVIALVLGILIYHEKFSLVEALASGCLLMGVLVNYLGIPKTTAYLTRGSRRD